MAEIKRKNVYDILLFDADDTLLDFKRSEREALCDTLRESGIEPTEASIARYSEINLSFWKLLERGEVTKTRLRTERFRVFCEELGYTVDHIHLADAYMDFLSQKSYLIDGAEEICRKLCEHCKMYIVTNGLKNIQQPRFAASGLEKYFSGVFISDDIGYEKPDIRFFDFINDAVGGIDKARALIIGDSLSSDMRGGISFGIDTCLYDPKQKGYPENMEITYTVAKLSELESIVLSQL